MPWWVRGIQAYPPDLEEDSRGASLTSGRGGGAERGTRNAERGTLVAALFAYAILVGGYATLTPIWQNPDEPAHYNYLAHVARTGALPELLPGDWNSALLERLKNGRLEPGDSIDAIRYEAWQTPLFYLAAAPIFKLGPDLDVAAVVLRLRAFNAIFGALTLGVAYFIAREVLQAHVAPAVPLAMVGVPMFTSVSASISADPLANLVSAGLVLVLIRRLRRPRARSETPRWPIGSGALLGLGILTKLAVVIFAPLVLLVVLVTSSRRVRDCLLVLVSSGLVLLPWLVHQVTTYGWWDPLAFGRHATVVLDQPRPAGLTAEYVLKFLTVSFHSFWAQFGWMGIVAPERMYWIWGLLSLSTVVGLAIDHRRFWHPQWRLLIGVVAAAMLAFVVYNLSFEQFQGRYLFTALVPIATLLVAGWSAVLPCRLQAWGTLLVASVLVALNAFALTRVLVPGFAPLA